MVVKNQHYVPQFYLKNFANKNDQVYVFDKHDQKVFKTSIRNIASESYFYDFPENKISLEDIENKQAVERALSYLESEFKKVLNNTISACYLTNPSKLLYSIIINDRQKVELSYFITIQSFRTKEWRKIVFGIIKALKKHIDYDDIIFYQAEFMFNSKIVTEIASTLYSHIWLFGFNKTGKSLYTSDNPVVKRNKMTNKSTDAIGFSSTGVEIAIPLSNNILISMLDRMYFKDLASFDGKLLPLTLDEIELYNSLQVIQSDRQIYCVEDDFKLSYEICKRTPDLFREKYKINIDPESISPSKIEFLRKKIY